SVLSQHPRRRDVAPTRPHLGCDPGRPRTAARRDDPRGTSFLRARHAGARGATPRTRGRPKSGVTGMTTSPTAVQPIPRGGMARLVGRRLTDWIPGAVVFVGTIALWEGLIRAFDVQEFLLPKPSAIASTFWNTRGQLWSQGWFTFQEALGGFVLGSGLAILVALALARW